MKFIVFNMSAILLIGGCAEQNERVDTSDAALTLEQVTQIVGQTDEPVCRLKLAPGLTDHDSTLAKMSWGEFADYRGYAQRVQAAAGPDFIQYTRRAALHRRLHVPEGEDIDASAYYDALEDGIPTPQTFDEHVRRIDYWDDRIREQHERNDADSGEYNMRFCVINEKGGVARAAAQQFILDGLADNSLTFTDHINGFLQGREFLGGPFKRKLFDLAADEQRGGLSLVTKALMRDRQTMFVASDPTTADAFWQARDAEIDAILDHIEKTDFASRAHKLKAMTSIDQSLRHMFGAVLEINAHFDNEAEATKMREGLPERVVRVDAFNTAQLEGMLEGRGWITDILDGKGAASDAWLIAQHADQKPDFQRRVLKLMEKVLDEPGVSKSNYAYLWDRVADKDGKPQRYGTQGQCTGPGTWEPNELEDPDNVDARRAEVGLEPLAKYKTRFKTMCY